MSVIHERLKIFCKNNENEYELFYPSFTENDVEIRIKTQAKESELHRGWIGDLFYNTTIRDTHDPNLLIDRKTVELCKDVLLAKINLLENDGNIEWEYVFLKK